MRAAASGQRFRRWRANRPGRGRAAPPGAPRRWSHPRRPRRRARGHRGRRARSRGRSSARQRARWPWAAAAAGGRSPRRDPSARRRRPRPRRYRLAQRLDARLGAARQRGIGGAHHQARAARARVAAEHADARAQAVRRLGHGQERGAGTCKAKSATATAVARSRPPRARCASAWTLGIQRCRCMAGSVWVKKDQYGEGRQGASAQPRSAARAWLTPPKQLRRRTRVKPAWMNRRSASSIETNSAIEALR